MILLDKGTSTDYLQQHQTMPSPVSNFSRVHLGSAARDERDIMPFYSKNGIRVQWVDTSQSANKELSQTSNMQVSQSSNMQSLPSSNMQAKANNSRQLFRPINPLAHLADIRPALGATKPFDPVRTYTFRPSIQFAGKSEALKPASTTNRTEMP